MHKPFEMFFTGYSNTLSGYDICLLKLSSPINVTGITTGLISLPPSGNQLSGVDESSCYISGWGRTESIMPMSYFYDTGNRL